MYSTSLPIDPTLAGQLLERADTICHSVLHDRNVLDLPYASLSAGAAAAATLMAHGAIALDRPRYADYAYELMDHALSRMDLGAWSLFGGSTGLALCALQLDALLDSDEYSRSLDDYDEVLRAGLSRPWAGHYDLVSGLCGIGVYSVARASLQGDHTLVDTVFAHLEAMSSFQGERQYWATTPAMMPWSPMWQRLNTDMVWDVGMAHGNAGVSALLAKAIEREVAPASATTMLRNSIAWLRACEMPRSADGAFPNLIGDPNPSRGAWCYGDFGVGNALLLAGHALEDASLSDDGVRVLRAACLRSEASLQVDNPWLCHGHAGLAHLLNRTFRACGADELLQRAGSFYQQALCSEAAHMYGPQERTTWSFLEGRIGCALAYLDVQTPGLWDMPFLLV